MKKEVVRLERVYKSFDGVPTLQDFSLNLMEGEILGVLGPSDSGKTTIGRIIAGEVQIDAGQVFINGRLEQPSRSFMHKKRDVFFIQKHSCLISGLSVAENLYLTAAERNHFIVNRTLLRKKTEDLLRQFDIGIEPLEQLRGYAEDQYYLFELMKAKAMGTKIIIIDSLIDHYSVADLKIFYWLVSKMRSQGFSFIILGSRDRGLVDFVDRISILRDGRILKSVKREAFPLKEYQARFEYTNLIAPEFLSSASEYDIALDVQFAGTGQYDNAPLKFSKGTITGVFDTHRTYIPHSLIADIESGKGFNSLTVDGKQICFRSCKEAQKKGIGLMPSGIINAGIFPDMNFLDNILISSKSRLGPFFLFNLRTIRYLKSFYGEQLGLTKSDYNAPVRELDIYTRQKIYLYHWDFVPVQVLFCENPFEGTDAITKDLLIQFFRKKASQNIAVAVYGFNFDDLLDFCDRIYFIRNGRVEGQYENPNFFF